MTSPFLPERTESLRPATAGGSGLNAEYASMIRNTQQPSVDKPQVLSADGTHLNIPPLSTENPATASVVATDNKATVPTQPTTNDQSSASQTTANEQLPASVAYDPSLAVPSWQRFSQTPVATDGSIMPATGPGSPGDPGPGAAIPMWMRFAPPGMLNAQNSGDPNFAADTGQGVVDPTNSDQTQTGSDQSSAPASSSSSGSSDTSTS